MSLKEQRRAAFEEKAFAQRFLHSIQRVNDGQFGLQPVDCPTKEEFTARDAEGNYLEESLNYAWWGYNAALDGVVVDLSKYHGGQAIPGSERMFLSDVRAAIEAAGVRAMP